MNQPSARITPAMERHFQTLVLTIATAAVVALATFTFRTQETLARLDERVSKMADDLGRARQLAERVSDQSESKEAHARDITRVDQTLNDHEQRLRAAENARPRR